MVQISECAAVRDTLAPRCNMRLLVRGRRHTLANLSSLPGWTSTGPDSGVQSKHRIALGE
jgi:hypothetical protein